MTLDTWTVEQALLVSKLAYEAGRWREQADAGRTGCCCGDP
ncbi:MAG: hypothetical protein ACRDY7_09790 [Acidimicrobiia bacterium]